MWMLRQESDDRQNKPRRAEAALQGMAFVKCLLHRMERRAVAGEAFDRRHVVALALHREHQTRPHRRSVQQHGAAAAYAVLATDMGSGQAQVVAEMIGQ